MTAARGTSLKLAAPADYLLSRDVCSYGYFLLSPNHWSPGESAFTTTMNVGERAVTVRVTQPQSTAGGGLSVRVDARLGKDEQAVLRARLVRMLRLDETAEYIGAFHAVDKRFRASGRGRLMRSPTFFEDVIKTVTSCNVTWPSTIIMNRRLCEVAGARSASGLFAFPTAEKLARIKPATLRARCSVGYRDARIVELAKMHARGEVVPAWFEDPATKDEDVWEALLELPGIGPYAAANIMQLLGRYGRLPLDTESVRHGRDVLGFKGTPAQIMKRVHAHFEPFGVHAFRSYWFEVWAFYEQKRGPAWTWERETTGKTFTAAKLTDKDVQAARASAPSVRKTRGRSTRDERA